MLRHVALNSPINSCPLPQLTPLNHYPSTLIFQSAPTRSLNYREDVVAFVNSYPNLEVSHELQRREEYNSTTPLVLSVTLTRDTDESDGDDGQTVVSPLYPSRKLANWWLVIGNPSTRQLLSIRKVTVRQELTVKLEFNLPRGEHKLKLYVICDSYMGADHDINLDPITVVEGEESDSGEELESSDEAEE